MRLVVEMCSESSLILKEPRVPSARVGPDGARTDCAIVRVNYNSLSISLYFLVPSAFLFTRQHQQWLWNKLRGSIIGVV